MTETIEGPMFQASMDEIVHRIGPYPHAALRRKGKRRKTGSRLLAVKCPMCGYALWGARAWLKIAPPKCPNPNCDALDEPMTVQWRTRPEETQPPPGSIRPDFET